MPDYSYTAVDAQGATQSGRLSAPDSRQAALALRIKGLFPTAVQAADGGLGSTASGKVEASKSSSETRDRGRARWFRGRCAKPKELALFTRQLATLTHAGMPLLRGLEVLARQERNRAFQQVLREIALAIRSGGTFSEALANYPREFNRLYLSMIRAGEAAGVLDVVLERLARFQEKGMQLKGKLTAALVYPVIVLAVAASILCGLLVFVVPKFQMIFADLLKGAPLPALTQAVLTASDAIKSHLLIIGVIAVFAGVGFKLFRRTPRGERLTDAMTLRAPLFGELVLKAVVARFGRTLGTLLSSGVPILPALLITRDTCDNAGVAGAIMTIHDRVKEGAPVAQTLEGTGSFPPMVASMIDVGEHTGQLAEMLGKVADIYEDEVDTAVSGLSSLIEPLLIVFLALVVGTIVIALFLPIVRIVQLMS